MESNLIYTSVLNLNTILIIRYLISNRIFIKIINIFYIYNYDIYYDIYYDKIWNQLHRSARFCCWAAEDHFRSDFLRRIRIRVQNRTIMSGFLDI